MIDRHNVKEVHVFDLDHTLTVGDTFSQFLRGLFTLEPKLWVYLPLLGVVFLAMCVRLIGNGTAKRIFLTTLLPKVSELKLSEWCLSLARSVEERGLNQPLLKHLQTLQCRGVHTVMATASPDLYVNILASNLAFEAVICTQISPFEKGICSGHLLTPNCYGKEKAARASDYVSSHFPGAKVWFYTDHHSDIPLLQQVDHPVMVCPTKALRAFGEQHGYTLFSDTVHR